MTTVYGYLLQNLGFLYESQNNHYLSLKHCGESTHNQWQVKYTKIGEKTIDIEQWSRSMTIRSKHVCRCDFMSTSPSSLVMGREVIQPNDDQNIEWLLDCNAWFFYWQINLFVNFIVKYKKKNTEKVKS